jgi:tetratricopeptide (TPR) repeat protein/phage anti-repressor protein
MAKNLKNPFQFWHELKERKVVHVIIVYTASAFALLQAVDMIFPRLGFPSWTITLSMILLACGLVIAIVLSWVYDITPEGIRRTGDVESIKPGSGSAIEVELPLDKSSPRTPDDDQAANEKRLFAEKLSRYKKKEKIYSLSSLVVILAVVGFFFFSGGFTVPFEKRDWIVISDFENLTENPVFDKSLYTAFSLTINQSRHINVLPRNKMAETLARMKIKDTGYLDERTAREIAMREGIKIFLAPNISEVGNRFVITAKILDTETGNLLRSEVLNAENKDDILSELDRLSRKIRRDLGESRYNIALQDKPLSKVTTSSLEALKQFSLGIDCHWKLDFTGARTYYENALHIDTGFTAAKASLGNLLLENFGDERGKELISQAVKSIDNLTDKEKYAILSFYAVKVEKNLSKGIENTRILTELYPDDATYHNNLGYFLFQDKQYGNALKAYKTAIRLDKTQALTYSGILWIYIEKLGDVDSAMVWAKKMIADNPQNAWGYYNLGAVYVCLDSLDSSVTAFQKAREVNPYLTDNLYRLAHSYRLQGLYGEAIRILERISEINKYDIGVNYNLGVVLQLAGNTEKARKYFTIFIQRATNVWLKQYPDMGETYTTLGAAFARLGDTADSQQMLQKAISVDSTIYVRFAEVLCDQGNISDAIDQIEKALGNGYRFLYWLKANPDLQPLQNEPRFRELLDKYFKLNI